MNQSAVDLFDITGETELKCLLKTARQRKAERKTGCKF